MTEDRSVTTEYMSPPTRWERVKESITLWIDRKLNPLPDVKPFEPILEVINFQFLSSDGQRNRIENIILTINNKKEFTHIDKLANLISLFKFLNIDSFEYNYDQRHKKFYEICNEYKDIINLLRMINNGDELNFLKRCGPIVRAAIMHVIKDFEEIPLTKQTESDDEYKISLDSLLLSLIHYKKELNTYIPNILKTMSNEIYERAFAKQAAHFKKSKSEYRWNAAFSMGGVLLFACLIIAWVLNIFCDWSWIDDSKSCTIDIKFDDFNIYALIYAISEKTIVTIVLFIILTVFLRSYFANCHNKVLNHNRYNTLKTCQHLYSITRESDIILQKGTEAMFDQLPTGYSKLQSDKGGDNTSFADIARILSKLVKRG